MIVPSPKTISTVTSKSSGAFPGLMYLLAISHSHCLPLLGNANSKRQLQE
jgi:hypothetical protein